MPTIKIPAVLGDGSATERIDVDGETVRAVFDNHATEHGSDLRDSVIEDGAIKEFINVYVDGSPAESLDVEVDDDAKIRIIPAASGGTEPGEWTVDDDGSV